MLVLQDANNWCAFFDTNCVAHSALFVRVLLSKYLADSVCCKYPYCVFSLASSIQLTKVRADLAAEADRRIQTITDDAARKVGDALADADQRISATLEDATISKEKIAADAEERVSIAEKASAYRTE